MQNKFTCKNQYGYTIKDLYIDYENKTYKTGDLFYSGGQRISKMALNYMIEQLKASDFKEI